MSWTNETKSSIYSFLLYDLFIDPQPVCGGKQWEIKCIDLYKLSMFLSNFTSMTYGRKTCVQL